MRVFGRRYSDNFKCYDRFRCVYTVIILSFCVLVFIFVK